MKISLLVAVWVAMVAGLAGAAAAQPAGGDKAAPRAEELVYVKMTTSMGPIILELNQTRAPESVKNFLKYADSKFYDGTIFHRVIKGFMIQGGGFTADMKQKKTDPPIKNEWQNGLKNTRGTIAMARQGDRKPNPAKVDSATSQFFINVVDNASLDRAQPDGGAYAVFGRVVEGMETVDKIVAVKTGIREVPIEGDRPARMGDVPEETITIESVARLSDDEARDLKSRLSDSASGEPAPR